MINKQSLKLNILTFEPIESEVTFSFFKESRDGFYPLFPDEAPNELFRELSKTKGVTLSNLYTGFVTSENADFTVKVDLAKSTRFAKHYYRYLILEFLTGKGYITCNNLVKDIEVWVKEPKHSGKAYTAFDVFGLRVQYAQVTTFAELLVYYKGLSRILNQDAAGLNELSQDQYSRVLFNKTIFRSKFLPEEARYNLDKVYPVISKKMEPIYGMMRISSPTENKYKKWFSLITAFVSGILNDDELKKKISFHSFDFIDSPDRLIHQTGSRSNSIQLGLDNKVTVFTPKVNLKKYGPFRLPAKPVKFIMLFFEDDRDYANDFFLAMTRQKLGVSGKPEIDPWGESLYGFVRVKFDLDKDHSLKFTKEGSPLEELHHFLDGITLDTAGFNYVAIYISPFKKDESDDAKNLIYYQIKEILLNHHISSQVIFKESLHSDSFKKFYTLNIASAILAKAGGIPWRLERPAEEELVIGVGAFKSNTIGVRYIGNAFVFSNNGEFREFDCIRASESWMLAPKIKLMLQEYVNKNKDIKRLVIHFYKAMSNEEIKPIRKVLFELGFENLPIIIITINKTDSSDYLAFDVASDDLMPYSGTILNIARHRYLLFNNTHYRNTERVNIEGWHFPLKLGFKSTHPKMLDNKTIIKELIDQVYQFSRMYWKSVKQQNLPVTVKYPALVAEMFPYFEGEHLPGFGKTNLWFL